jgi:hypothetical protein
MAPKYTALLEVYGQRKTGVAALYYIVHHMSHALGRDRTRTSNLT